MCGIAGILKFKGQSVSTPELKAMNDTIAHRGPDGEGFWINSSQSLGLAHRRLSIIDLSEKASQPLHYLGRYTIIFNGEIYNYIELRDELKKHNYTFHSDSDTEVMLAAYDKYGANMLQYLDGMFAFAIWDEKEQQLFCARDRFGEKPFFYSYEKNNRFVFASEMKAIFKSGVERVVNKHMLYNFLVYHTEENPFNKAETFFENITSLEPAHFIQIGKDGAIRKTRYWHLSTVVNSSISFNDAKDKFIELFNVSIKRRLRSDVAVGSSLSGGIDSSAVVCTLHKLRNESSYSQNTFSARFHDPSKDEGKYMKMVIDQTSVKPHDIWLDENVLLDELDKVMHYQEEPFGSSSILAQWKVMELAKRENVTVLLDGQGADETLAGYTHFFRPFFTELYLNNSTALKAELESYKQLRGANFIIDSSFKLNAVVPGLMKLSGMLKRKFTTPEYCRFMADDFIQAYKGDQPPFTQFHSLNDSLDYYTNTYGLGRLLRFADRNAMAHSREVRLPFLSHEFVEFIFSLPATYKMHNGWTKYILRESMEGILPADIAKRVDKLGFQPPQQTWMMNTKVIEKTKSSREYLIKEGIINPKYANLADDWTCLITSTFLRSK